MSNCLGGGNNGGCNNNNNNNNNQTAPVPLTASNGDRHTISIIRPQQFPYQLNPVIPQTVPAIPTINNSNNAIPTLAPQPQQQQQQLQQQQNIIRPQLPLQQQQPHNNYVHGTTFPMQTPVMQPPQSPFSSMNQPNVPIATFPYTKQSIGLQGRYLIPPQQAKQQQIPQNPLTLSGGVGQQQYMHPWQQQQQQQQHHNQPPFAGIPRVAGGFNPNINNGINNGNTLTTSNNNGIGMAPQYPNYPFFHNNIKMYPNGQFVPRGQNITNPKQQITQMHIQQHPQIVMQVPQLTVPSYAHPRGPQILLRPKVINSIQAQVMQPQKGSPSLFSGAIVTNNINNNINNINSINNINNINKINYMHMKQNIYKQNEQIRVPLAQPPTSTSPSLTITQSKSTPLTSSQATQFQPNASQTPEPQTAEEDKPVARKRGPKKGVKRGKYKKHKNKDGSAVSTASADTPNYPIGDNLTIAHFGTQRRRRKQGRPGRKRGRRRRVQPNGVDGNGSDEDYKSGYPLRKRGRTRYYDDDFSDNEYYDDDNGDESEDDDDDDRNGDGNLSSDISDSDDMSNLEDSFVGLSSASSSLSSVADPLNSQGIAQVVVEKIFTHRIVEKDFPVPPSPEPNFHDLHYLHHKRTAADRGIPSWLNMEESGSYIDNVLGVDISNVCPVFTEAEIAEEHERLNAVAERLRAKRREMEPRVVAEYLVKIKGRSYIHTTWLDATEMSVKDRLKVKRYWKKIGFADEAEGVSLKVHGIQPTDDDYNPVNKNDDDDDDDEDGKVIKVKEDENNETGDNEKESEKGSKVVRKRAERGIGKGLFFSEAYTEIDRIVGSSKSLDGSTTLYYVKWCELPYTEATWEREEDIDDPEKIEEYKRFHLPPAEKGKKPLDNRLESRLQVSPEYCHHHALRDFQLDGLNWLIYCWCHRTSSILADEMGLGKTVQSISFMHHLRRVQLIQGPFLVVAPLSTIANWKREVEEWTDMNVVVYTGNAQNRAEIKRWEWFYLDENGRELGKDIKFNILLTTYDMVRNDAELPHIKWKVLVVDEAQNVKNFKGKLMEALRGITTDHKILLTGTPIQNSVEELWSLLQFIDPQNFSDREEFLKRFGRIEQVDQAQALRDTLRPYMLHRKKSDVDKGIPPLEETIIEVELSMLQKQYYRAIYERNRDFLNRGASVNIASSPTNGTSAGDSAHTVSTTSSGNYAVTPLNNVMMQLRKVCDHPFLLENVEQKEVPANLAATNPVAYMNTLVRASGKTVLIDKLLPKLKADGHKVLIFSQLKGVLDLLERYLTYHGYLYERIDGSVKGADRNAAIDRFNRPGSDRFAFLLSTRAGGLGINLQAADTVILYDSDWNPQNDVQAQARSHRIGQKKQVKVYRLVTKDTYERQMFEIASRKLGLDRAIMANVNIDSAASPTATVTSSVTSSVTGLNKEEMQRLLMVGAYGLRKDEEESFKETEAFNESTIDDILKKRTKNIIHHDDGQGSQFSMAAFTFNDTTSDVKLDDPDFWKKTLPEAATSKALLNQFTDAINRSEERRQEWKQAHKCPFLHRLEEVVDDVLKSFNEARGDMSITERTDALDLAQLCLTHPEFFTEHELTRLNEWFDKLTSSCSRRKTRVVDYFAQGGLQNASNSLSSRRKQSKKSTTARKRKNGSDDDDDDNENEFGARTPTTAAAAGAYMSDEEYEKKAKTLKLRVKKRRKMTVKGDDDDDDDSDNGDDSGEDYEDNNDIGDDDVDDETGKKRQKRLKKRSKDGDDDDDDEESKKRWTDSDRRSIQDSTFSFCRPYWAGIRTRARLTRKPIKEIRDTVMYFLSQVVACTKGDAKYNEGFKAMHAFFVKEDTFDESAGGDNDGDNDGDTADMAKKRRKVANSPAPTTETIPPAYALPETREELKTIIATRADGWFKRWRVMSAIGNEVTAAKAEGRKPLEKSGPLAKSPSMEVEWWDPKVLDSDLFAGLYKHGWGSYDAIVADESLGFSKVLRAKIAEYRGQEKPSMMLHRYVGWPASRALESHVKALIKSVNAQKGKPAKPKPNKKKQQQVVADKPSSPVPPPQQSLSSTSRSSGESKTKKTAQKKKTTITITTKNDKKKLTKE